MKIRNSTLCYIEKDNKYLMLHRVVKKNDVNKDKWIGVGGHFEYGESPEDCVLREVKEETGLTLLDYKYRGIVHFISEEELNDMHLFTATEYTGEIADCDEGVLEWISKTDLMKLPMWEGDKYFDSFLSHEGFVEAKFTYKDDKLIEKIIHYY